MLNRKKVPAATVIGTTGALLIAIPAAVGAHPVRVGFGVPVGVAITLGLIWLGYTNRRNTEKTRAGLPAWAAGLPFAGVVFGFVLSGAGFGFGLLFGLIGGMLFTYAIVLAVLPDVLPADRKGVRE